MVDRARQRAARAGALAALLLIVAAIGWLDYATRPTLSLALAYLLPILAASWPSR